jgi:hypothetical protein
MSTPGELTPRLRSQRTRERREATGFGLWTSETPFPRVVRCRPLHRDRITVKSRVPRTPRKLGMGTVRGFRVPHNGMERPSRVTQACQSCALESSRIVAGATGIRWQRCRCQAIVSGRRPGPARTAVYGTGRSTPPLRPGSRSGNCSDGETEARTQPPHTGPPAD